ncbi:MAG: hypothetical protein N4A40_13975 [Tissierellales bacterium]|nr:hypothetical protein [Tissierellales bacterium]
MNKCHLFLKYNPEQISNMPKNFRNVKNIGHFGTGDLEIRIRSIDDIHTAKPYIEEAIRIIGEGWRNYYEILIYNEYIFYKVILEEKKVCLS